MTRLALLARPTVLARPALLAVLALAACGADGAPQPPAPGITLSGTAAAGVVGKVTP